MTYIRAGTHERKEHVSYIDTVVVLKNKVKNWQILNDKIPYSKLIMGVNMLQLAS